MKIQIKTTIHIPEVPGEVEIEGGSLRDLLERLFRNSYFVKEIVDPATGELSLDGLFLVSLNDTPYHALPDGLETMLKDQDKLTLALILIGGG
ncbi:MAG TPA: hypothetical protein VGJ94_18015 [Syntrophorhabdaceae bacterium]|jgi:ferric-dicitrate binding protein FerR (iron transport regulator)